MLTLPSYPEPGIVSSAVAYLALIARRFLMSRLMLPRFGPSIHFSEPDSKTGRISHYDYLVQPYYNPPTFWGRWGPLPLMTRLLGGIVPGSAKLQPEGFLIREVGPDNRLGKGGEFMDACEEKLRVQRTGRCPYSG